MRLYIYRQTQCADVKEAIEDGALRYIGSYETVTQGDIALLEDIKQAIEIAVECVDMSEKVRFVEVT